MQLNQSEPAVDALVILSLGSEIVAGARKQFTRYIDAEACKWPKVIRVGNINVE